MTNTPDTLREIDLVRASHVTKQSSDVTDGAGTKLSEREAKALKALAESYDPDGYGFLSFKTIAKRSGLDPPHVRRTVRALARKGLAEYGRGLWTDEGEMAGSGYSCTKAGSARASLSTDLSPSSRDDSFCDPSLNNSISVRGGA